MRLLIATGVYEPESGGPATYSALLEQKLPERGFEVRVLPFRTVRHLPKIVRHIAYTGKLISLGKRADVLYALDPVSVGVPTMVASFFLRKPYVVKIVGDYAWEQGAQRFGITETLDGFLKRKNFPLAVRALRGIESFVARRAVQVVVPSKYLQRVVERWGVPTRRITVIPNAVSLSRSGHKLVLRALIKYHGPIIITAGRLVPWKGIHGLLDAMVLLKKNTPDFKLLIVGDGPLMTSLEIYAEECGLLDQVIFTGALKHDVAMAYLKASDVLALNTSYEGFSHLLLESMTLGTAIVTTPVGGNKELIEHGKNGLLVPHNDAKGFADALRRILSDDALRRKLSDAGKRTAGKYSEEVMIGKTATFFKSL